jgi:hypothetical protein
VNGICLTCAQLKTRRWAQRARRRFARNLRAGKPGAVLATAFAGVLGLYVVLAGILTLVYGLAGW